MPNSPKAVATPFKFVFTFTLLIVVSVMLAMAGLYFQSYRALEKEVNLRVNVERELLQQSPHNLLLRKTLYDDTILFNLSEPLPAEYQGRLKEAPTLLPRVVMEKLGWQQYGLHRDAVVALITPAEHPPVVVAIPLNHRAFVRLLVRSLLYLAILILILMMAYGFLIRRRILWRVGRIDETAQLIMQGDMAQRIPIAATQHDEFTHLSLTLNAMLEKIDTLMHDLRQVNNNIAHDLKSPLNRLRSRMEVALMNHRSQAEYEAALAQSIEDVDALLQTFNALLLMGNLDSNTRNYQLEPIDLSDLLQDLGELYSAIAEEKQHQLHIDIGKGIRVLANRNLLAQAIGNLLENAIKYTPQEGVIELKTTNSGNMVLVTISDNGPGIPKGQTEAVFERFTRLDQSRNQPGTGLGLALVRSILDSHHASIRLCDNHPGLRVEVRIKML